MLHTIGMSIDAADVASDLARVRRLHVSAGQRPRTPGTRHCGAARPETPDFIRPDLWPASSQYLNPIDYRIREFIQERVYQTYIRDIDDPKQSLISVWNELKQSVVDTTIDQCRPSLSECVPPMDITLNSCLIETLLFSC